MRAPAPIRRTVRNVTRRRFEERFPGKLPGQGIRTAPSLGLQPAALERRPGKYLLKQDKLDAQAHLSAQSPPP